MIDSLTSLTIAPSGNNVSLAICNNNSTSVNSCNKAVPFCVFEHDQTPCTTSDEHHEHEWARSDIKITREYKLSALRYFWRAGVLAAFARFQKTIIVFGSNRSTVFAINLISCSWKGLIILTSSVFCLLCESAAPRCINTGFRDSERALHCPST